MLPISAKNDCPLLPAPDNGGFVCVGQPRTNTQRCQVKCNSGYEHVLEPSYYEECGPTSNWQWSHTLRDVPIMPCERKFSIAGRSYEWHGVLNHL